MAEEQKYLFHCGRCGSLFQSIRRDKEYMRCVECGEHPVKSKFSSVNEMPALDSNDKKSKYGTPNIDEADIYMMQKNRRKRQGILLSSIALLIMLIIVIKMYEKSQKLSKSSSLLGKVDRDYMIRKNDALKKCMKRFTSFASDTVTHSKLLHILNGNELVYDMNRYYSSNLMNNDLASADPLKYDLNEQGEQTKLTIVYRYQPKSEQIASAYEFEVLFWKKEGDWFIDWIHFVRLGDMNWFRFTENKELNSPKRFRLYARKLSAESVGTKGYEEYKFSEAHNNSSMPSQIPRSVYVKKQTALRNKINNKLQKIEIQKLKTANIANLVANFDPPRTIRIDATIDFQEIEGERIMVLKEIHNLNWETPPSKDDDN